MKKHKITTRLVEDDDLPAVLDMVHDLAAHHGDVSTLTLAGLKRGAKDWHRIIVACIGADVVGYASLLPMGQLQFGVRGMDMHHLFVLAEHRRIGVGRVLMDASIALSSELSCQYLTVGTHPENQPAAQMYLAAGFEPLVNGPRFRMLLK